MGNYNGSIELISGIKQKNNGNFPLMEAGAVQVNSDGKRLDEELEDLKKSSIPEISDDGYWVIDGNDTGVSAVGKDAQVIGKYIHTVRNANDVYALATESYARAYNTVYIRNVGEPFILRESDGIAKTIETYGVYSVSFVDDGNIIAVVMLIEDVEKTSGMMFEFYDTSKGEEQRVFLVNGKDATQGGGIAEETDPTVPQWVKDHPDMLTATDVGARPADWMPTAQQVGADPVNTAKELVNAHNTSTGAHFDIRTSLSKKAEKSDIPTVPVNVSAFTNDAEYVDKTTLDEAIEEVASVSSILENIQMLPHGGSKEWLEKNGDKSQLYQIGGYIWGYVESNGWTRSDTQFLVVSSESQMTNEGGIPYLLRNGDEGTVYGYTAASGDFDTPVYDSLPETANDGDIVAVGSKKYKASVGTKEVPAYTNLFDYDTMTTDDNLNQRVGSSGVTAQDGYWSALGIPVSVKAGDTVTIRTKGAVKQTTAYSYSRILLYDANGARSTSTPTSTMGSTTAKWTISDEGDGVYSYSKVIEDDNVELQVGFYIGSGRITANDVKNLIITFNEEIKTKTETTVTWENIGTYTPPVEAGWSATAESYSVIDRLSATAASGTSSVFSGDGYIYTYVSGSAWMQMSKYDKPSLAVDKELSDTSANAVQNKVIKSAIDIVETKANKNASNIATINERIAGIETGNDTWTVPTFWQDAVDTCISKIKTLQVGRNCITFPFFSDYHEHPNGYSGMLIAHIMKECNIPYCFFGGDSISNGTIADEATMIAQEKAFKTAMSYIPNGRFCRAIGNHDGYWKDGTGATFYYTDAQNYDLFLRDESIAQNKHFGGDGTYYYVEDIASKVRWVILDTNDEVVEDEQLNWLENTALSFNESGWAVVLISHQPLSNHYHAKISNAEAVRTIIRNYINGTDVNKADVIGCFSGHIHRDRIYIGAAVNITDDTQGDSMGFTQVTITSDKTSISYDDATKHAIGNDDQSHAIDFVTVNKSTRTVNITRLGIGNDRSYSY